jgi:hypothetical protein
MVERPILSCLAALVGEIPDSINFRAEVSFSLSGPVLRTRAFGTL